jgi:hypothetical protein
MIRLFQPNDLGSLPADKSVESRMRGDKPGWLYGLNLSPYIFEIQEETAQPVTVVGPFAPYCHPLHRRTEKLIFHAIVAVSGATPVPATQFAVYFELSEFEPRMENIAWSAPMGPGSSAVPSVVQIKDGAATGFATVGTPNTDGAQPFAALVTETMTLNFNGTGSQLDRGRSASAVNLGAQSGLGAALVAPPGEWSLFSNPAANMQATATRAASAGVRHIARMVCADILAQAAPAAIQVYVQLRDSTTGAGAVLFNRQLALQAVAGAADHAQPAPLALPGTLGNAMTWEFVGAGGANVFETISASGFDAS